MFFLFCYTFAVNIVLFSAEEIDKPLNPRDERAKHIRGVLHKGAGDSFEAGIINGKSGIATITAVTDAGLYFTFAAQTEEPPLFNIQLIVGFPRPIQLKRLLRDVSSLGVAQVHLTGTELGEKSYRQSTLLDRGAAFAGLVDGAAQAKTTRVPELFMHDSLKECLRALGFEKENAKPIEERLKNVSGFPQAAQNLVENSSKNQELIHNSADLCTIVEELKKSDVIPILLDNVKPVCSLSDFAVMRCFEGKTIVAAIGSERGWTQKERELFYQLGFLPCSLGRRILRTETACTSAVTLLLAGMNEL